MADWTMQASATTHCFISISVRVFLVVILANSRGTSVAEGTVVGREVVHHICRHLHMRWENSRNPLKDLPRKLWSLDSMAAALSDVQNGTNGLREAARAYKVPVETQRRRVTEQVSLDSRSGPSTTLTKEEEEVYTP